MNATIIPLGVIINALRIDNNKITPALFQQFEVGCLLDDIGWPGFLHGDIEFFTTPFTNLGRHTYKIANEDQKNVPFLYCVNNEVKVSTISALKFKTSVLLNELHSAVVGKRRYRHDIY
jgi:hypothetical protein